jgi:hypothetical protein
MATEHGADTTPFGSSIGRLSPGCFADAVVLDWRRVTYPYQSPDIPPVDVLVQRARASTVKTVLVAGRTVYTDGRFTGVDRDATLAEIARRLSAPLAPAEQERRMLSAAVVPVVRRFYDGYLDELETDPFYRQSSRT